VCYSQLQDNSTSDLDTYDEIDGPSNPLPVAEITPQTEENTRVEGNTSELNSVTE